MEDEQEQKMIALEKRVAAAENALRGIGVEIDPATADEDVAEGSRSWAADRMLAGAQVEHVSGARCWLRSGLVFSTADKTVSVEFFRARAPLREWKVRRGPVAEESP